MLMLKKLRENYPQKTWILAPGLLEFRKITINLPRIGRSQDHTNAWLLDRRPAFKSRENAHLYMILPSFEHEGAFFKQAGWPSRYSEYDTPGATDELWFDPLHGKAFFSPLHRPDWPRVTTKILFKESAVPFSPGNKKVST
jgi:hypothetical protein